jgi:hypothetical protein
VRLVRVPVLPKHADRVLVNAIWDTVKYGNMDDRLGLCILHCAMRSMESSLKWMLKTISDSYKEGKGGARAIVDEHLNDVVVEKLKLRRLVRLDEDGELVKIDLSGEEVRDVIPDLCKPHEGGSSVLLDAVRTTREKLGLNTGNMAGWEACLTHWALAMRAGYVLKATKADRQTFRENVRWYVLKKVTLHDESLCWYDWQLYSVLTKLFDAFGSLRLICQEGMDGQQKLNNDLQRRSNQGANAGRVPNRVRARGIEAIAAYMRERKLRVKSAARWMWEAMLLSFMATFQDVFERYEGCKAAGRVVDWAATYVPAWASFKVLMLLRVGRLARARRKLDAKHNLPGERYYGRLLAEYHAYYARTSVDMRPGLLSLTPEDRMSQQRQARRRRWRETPSILHDPIYGGQGPTRPRGALFCQQA